MRSVRWLVAVGVVGLVACGGAHTQSPPVDGGSGNTGPAVDAGAGSGGTDAGATPGNDGGSGGGGGGSGTDGGTTSNDCDGLMPGTLPARVQYQKEYSNASQQNFCSGLPIGNMDGQVAVKTLNSHPQWTILARDGTEAGGFSFWSGEAWPDPIGFIGYSGSSSEQTVAVGGLDDFGHTDGTARIVGSGFFAPGPFGLFLVGRFGQDRSPSPDSDPVIFMVGHDGTVRYGPKPLGSRATVFGQAVDPNGRALVILDGGPGTISAIWFNTDGTPATEVFTILTGFRPGPNTWFEASPLLDGSMAVRRVDLPDYRFWEERRSQWLVVLPSGVARADPAPDWLAQRPDTRMELVRNRRAYAFLPWAAQVGTCNQQVEVASPSGASCGKLEFTVDGNACRTRELRLGLDGTVMQMLPADRETTRPGTTVTTCTVRFWPAALR